MEQQQAASHNLIKFNIKFLIEIELYVYFRAPRRFIDWTHLGQYHLPFGDCVMPTQG